jgi:hypothetical protein
MAVGSTSAQAGEATHVFGGEKPMTLDLSKAARRRLLKDFGAPPFTWQELRRTCGTFLTCAPGIYGAASAFLSAKRLGHSVVVAERNYVGALTEIPAEARTLEEAMGVASLVGEAAGDASPRACA